MQGGTAILLDVGAVLLGLALLLSGGEALVRGAARLARSLGLSPLAIGLTVVALGTSAPELAVNVTAAWQGSGEISFGNIVGSNLANIGLVVGLTALWRPLDIHASIVTREIPMMLLATAATFVAADALLVGEPGVFDRSDAAILLLLFLVFVYYTARDIRRQRADDPYIEGLAVRAERRPIGGVLLNVLLVAIGIVGLVVGAEFLVEGATGLARAAGISQALIGLTLVALGTSFPELAASLIAAWRGHADLAVGNVVGSNIFNLLLVMGASAGTAPVPTPPGGLMDLVMLLLLSFILLAVSSSYGRQVRRYEGGLLVVMYVVYLGSRALSAGGA